MRLLSRLAGLKSFANPWMLLGVLLLMLGAGASGLHYGVQLEAGKHAREELLIQQASNAAQQAAAEEIAKIKIIHQTNQTRLEREIVKVPDLSQCHAGSDVVRVLNDALAGKAGTEPTGSSLVPAADGVAR